MRKKYVILCLLAIIAIAAFLRLWQIKSVPPGFYPDEAMYANNALEALETGDFKVFYPENNGREGLWINIIAPFLAIFGNEPWVPRSAAAICGILTVLGLYFLTKELFRENSRGEIIALLSAFFLATSFWHINFSRIGFRAIMAPFFLIWGFYFIWKVIDGKSNVEKLHSTFYILLSGLLFGLGFHSYLAYRIAPLLLIIPFVLLWFTPSKVEGQAGKKKFIFVFLLFAFLAGLPLGIYFLQHPGDFFGRASQISVFASQTPLRDLGINVLKTVGMFFVAGDHNWRHNLPGAPQLWWPVAILFLVGIIISIKNLRVTPASPSEAGRARYAFLVVWLVIMLLPAIISNEGMPHALRSIVVIPTVMIFAALGMNWIISRILAWLGKNSEKHPEHSKRLLRVRKELIVFLLVFLLAIAVNAHNQYFFRWAPNPATANAFNENYVELGRYLNNLPGEIPKYVIINADGTPVRGIKMPAQTVMFITKTWLPEWRERKNIFYVDSSEVEPLIADISQKENFYIALLENDIPLRILIKEKIPDLSTDMASGNVIFYKLTGSKK